MEEYNINTFTTEYRQISRSEHYRRKKLRQKRIRRRRIFTRIVIVILSALLIFIIILICKAYSKDGVPLLNGIYLYGDSTEYEFDGNQNGCMCVLVDGEEYHFEYTYKTEDNRLYIDFSDEAVTDITYEYSVNGDKLTLVGKEGSAGGTYELTKK